MSVSFVPVCHPLLPGADELEPYLSRLNDARWYSNYGSLYREFRDALAKVLRVEPDHVTVVSNATIGLTLALAVRTRGERGLCMVPAWTFVASAAAVRWAGLTPYFVDVDAGSWSMTPELAERALADAPGPVVAVMPVSPFGAPIATEEWARFEARTGIPVVADGAAAIDSLVASEFPAVVSLHATKALGVGEGGVVVCRDPGFIEQVQKLANFGLSGDRVAHVAGMNAKISEYTAAVGLAAIDAWPAQRRHLIDLARQYVDALGAWVRFPPAYGSFASGTCVVWIDGYPVDALAEQMQAHGIGTLRWWLRACPDHPAFEDAPVAGMRTARRAAAETIGLPMSPTLTTEEVQRVTDALLGMLSSEGMGRSVGL